MVILNRFLSYLLLPALMVCISWAQEDKQELRILLKGNGERSIQFSRTEIVDQENLRTKSEVAQPSYFNRNVYYDLSSFTLGIYTAAVMSAAIYIPGSKEYRPLIGTIGCSYLAAAFASLVRLEYMKENSHIVATSSSNVNLPRLYLLYISGFILGNIGAFCLYG